MADGQRSTAELAAELDRLLGEARRLVVQCPPGRWGATTTEGWTVPALAHHAMVHASLAHWASAIARGEKAPFANFTIEMLNGYNAQQAREYAGKPKAEILAEIDQQAPAAVSALEGLDDAGLEKSQASAFFGGAPISGRRVIEDLLLRDLGEHVEHLRAAVEG